MKTTGVKKIMKDFEKENLAARLKRVKHNKIKTKEAGYLTNKTLNNLKRKRLKKWQKK